MQDALDRRAELMDSGLIRAGVFFGLVAVLMLAEFLAPRRKENHPRKRRWPVNLGIFLIDNLLTRGLVLIAATGGALWAAQQGFGVFHWLSVPPLVSIIACVILLDGLIWVQHWASHKIPMLWRFHRMHHSDVQIDVTTALRFHPVEIGLSMLYKLAIVVLLGAPLMAVVVFELVLNSSAMFNHANINLPKPLDRALRLLIVTPDMHRVHHTPYRAETDSNYGFCLSIWDRMFRTYTAQPRDGHLKTQIGLDEFRAESDQGFLSLLAQPFRSTPS